MATVKCLQCGVELTSKFRHDFQQCDCPNRTFVDGGQAYTRIGGMDFKLIQVMKEDILYPEEIKMNYNDSLLRKNKGGRKVLGKIPEEKQLEDK